MHATDGLRWNEIDVEVSAPESLTQELARLLLALFMQRIEQKSKV
jgi:hypothetical protein